MIRHDIAFSAFARQWAWRFIVGVAGLIFVTAIILSPILMQGVLARNPDLAQLSSIGQAYGGVSAVLSGLAFLGIAISLILQRKEMRVSQLVTARERHFELIKIVLERPELGSQRIPEDSDHVYSKKLLANLWLSHWRMLWDIGQTGDDQLRRDCIALFEDAVHREWWHKVRVFWTDDGTRKSHHFALVVDQAYEQVSTSDPYASSSGTDDTSS